MILVQTPWSAASADALSGVIAQALRTLIDQTPALVLLPHGDGAPADADTEAAVTEALSKLAIAHEIFLGGSAYVKTGAGSTQAIGYLYGPDGAQLIRMPKIMPDLVEGFSDATAETFKKRRSRLR